MSKERLEEIRNRMIVEKHHFKYLNSEKGYWENVYTLLEQDMNYLFDTITKQAERAQELESDYEHLESIIDRVYFDRAREISRANELDRQNERYREAIKRAIGKFNYDEHQEGMSILQKALEGEE